MLNTPLCLGLLLQRFRFIHSKKAKETPKKISPDGQEDTYKLLSFHILPLLDLKIGI